MTKQELWWLAGWMEGEGSFLCGPPSRPTTCSLSGCSTDLDTIQKVALILGTRYYVTSKKKKHYKTAYVCRLTGTRARDLMLKLKPLMSDWRQIQITKAVSGFYKRTKQRKFSAELIREIRASSGTTREIGKKFGLSHNMVSGIKTRKYYDDVE